jgi:hypothetical protein
MFEGPPDQPPAIRPGGFMAKVRAFTLGRTFTGPSGQFEATTRAFWPACLWLSIQVMASS